MEESIPNPDYQPHQIWNQIDGTVAFGQKIFCPSWTSPDLNIPKLESKHIAQGPLPNLHKPIPKFLCLKYF